MVSQIDEELQEQIEEKLKQGWIKTWFAVEVMATDKDITEHSLKEHIEKLEKVKGALVFGKEFKSIERVENPPKNVLVAYSQIAEVELIVKDLLTLITVVITFGPSAIEILEPRELRIKIDEVQNIVNFLAGLIHQFAQAGVGGIVIRPK